MQQCPAKSLGKIKALGGSACGWGRHLLGPDKAGRPPSCASWSLAGLDAAGPRWPATWRVAPLVLAATADPTIHRYPVWQERRRSALPHDRTTAAGQLGRPW